jgi:mercuric ion transport protein
MSTGKLMSAGIVSAITASLCCITPVFALIAGTGSIASSFSWIEPGRPYFIGLTIVVLGFAWYQKLRPQSTDDCGCATNEKPKFLQSKIFLLLVTSFAVLMLAFPSYSNVFFSNNRKETVAVEKSNIRTVELGIKGMTCEACEEHVNHEVNKLEGIILSIVSYGKKNAVIKFDISKTEVQKIIEAVNKTGYKVTTQSLKN